MKSGLLYRRRLLIGIRASLRQVDSRGLMMVPVKLGARVSHKKFGEDVVTNFEGSGSNARVEVWFNSAGSKWLVWAYANLEIL